MLTRYRKWRFDRIDRKQQRCSHEHMSASPEVWYWYRRGYKPEDDRYGNERYGCLRCDDCGAYKPCSPPVFDPSLECECGLPIKDPGAYFGALRCDDCRAFIPCSHEHTVVHGHFYLPLVYAPRLECADCGMPLKDPDMYGQDGSICSYPGHPEWNNTYRGDSPNTPDRLKENLARWKEKEAKEKEPKPKGDGVDSAYRMDRGE